ncbi:MAG: hypothetical protein KA807_14810 [Prolixibacteraceae bacterium]|nr:hypothetical protein [Prolixibacteraceae bacterium]
MSEYDSSCHISTRVPPKSLFLPLKGRNRLFGGTLVVVLWQFATDKAPPIKAVLLNLQK